MTQSTLRLTMAQAVAKFLTRQRTEIGGRSVPLFGGVFAIFGHGNVAGMGEALYQVQDELPTFRAHNEQGMAHAAIAYAKASFRFHGLLPLWEKVAKPDEGSCGSRESLTVI